MTEEEMKAAIEAVKNELKGEIDALKTKNSDLIKEKKAAKDEADEAKRLADEAEDAKSLASNDLEKIKDTLTKQHQKALDKLSGERDDAMKQLRTLTVENAIQSTLTSANVLPHMIKPLSAMFKANDIKIEDGVAKIDGVAITDHITEYLGGDDGKHYIAAPANSGAGAPGSTSTTTGHGFTKENFNMTEFLKIAKDKPAEANAVAERLGLPYRA